MLDLAICGHWGIETISNTNSDGKKSEEGNEKSMIQERNDGYSTHHPGTLRLQCWPEPPAAGARPTSGQWQRLRGSRRGREASARRWD